MRKSPARSLPVQRESAETTDDRTVVRSVELHLEAFLRDKRTGCDGIDPDFTEVVTARLTEFVTRGGKRLRPLFAWWGWRAGGGNSIGPAVDPVLRAVSALELIQACALVHDDIMDGSRTRRGAPSVHAALAAEHNVQQWSGSAEDFGESVAILVGDIALIWADDMLMQAGLSRGQLARVRGPWQMMRTEMMAGQFLDLYGQARRDDSESSALNTARLKTAAYSVERPLHIGAALAGAGESTVAALRGYGCDIGVAFQLRDDLLGVYGEPESTGKPIGDDLREGKRTFLMAMGARLARERGDDAALRVIEEVLGDPDIGATKVQAVREVLDDLGARGAVEKRIHHLAERGTARLGEVVIDPIAHASLNELAIHATARDR
ncbi:polyprenyl synthetase family protein [Nocardiopsis ansamitocini]|uniref:Geranylgeranyl pyrophosphate synthase n=1 Tax=Nocardiopsis ansamitocini TaxID=1670832 RepID=A0A9W6P4Q3_9ACTN|nr:polyprenyl synthetase family protein [Nocardiopsis ansamitocini]GLU46973.1 geranylgeranyl pyrophosphate synthase [Nocardiopsis ansamitocini]